jgi:hypothetical protein
LILGMAGGPGGLMLQFAVLPEPAR